MSVSYTVKSGDTLGAISIKYLGLWDKWRKIEEANPQLIGRKTAVDGSPLIFPGDVLIIPVDDKKNKGTIKNEKSTKVLDEKGDKEFSLLLNGIEFLGFTAFKLILNDDAPDAFSLSAPFDPKEEVFKKSFAPLTFMDCILYYKKKIIFKGKLSVTSPKIEADSRTIDLQGNASYGILSCAIPDSKFPPSYTGLKLSEIAADAATPFGISVSMEGDEGEAFDKVSYDVGGKILDFLSKLAKQRGLIITNTPMGNLKFWNNKPSESCGTFIEGEYRFISCTASFSESDFYSHITGYTKVDEKKGEAPQKYTFENKYLTKRGVLKPFAYTVEDSEKDDLETAVKAKAAAMLCACVSYELTVLGVTDKNGNLFKKGCCVIVKAPSAQIYSEFKFQAKSIEINRDDTNGLTTKLKLVLPGLRNNQIPTKWPWE